MITIRRHTWPSEHFGSQGVMIETIATVDPMYFDVVYKAIQAEHPHAFFDSIDSEAE